MAEEALIISYCTDIEGNLQFFQAYVGESRALSFDGTTSKLVLADGHGFVFGGDLFDKGPGDIRLAGLLCDLKDAHPSRVWLLIGNRDGNKLRFSSELDTPGEIGRLHDDPPFWDPSVPGLKSWLKAQGGLPHTRANRLKWILECTMGSPNAFEFRRLELAALEGAGFAGSIDDQAVTRSFADSVKHRRESRGCRSASLSSPPSSSCVKKTKEKEEQEEGFVLRYLRLAQLALRLGDTVFVHGAITRPGLLFVPSASMRHLHAFDTPEPGTTLPTHAPPEEWFAELNAFKREALRDHEARPHWDKGEAGREESAVPEPPPGVSPHYDRSRRKGGEALVAYQSRPASSRRGVVVESFAVHSPGPESQVLPLDAEVYAYLVSHGVRRVVAGHKPMGAAPAFVKYYSTSGAPREKPGDAAAGGGGDGDGDAAAGGGGGGEDLVAGLSCPRLTKESKNSSSSSSPLAAAAATATTAATTAAAAAATTAAVFEVIMADTSFSDPSAPDKRGGAVFDVVFDFSPPLPPPPPCTPTPASPTPAEPAAPAPTDGTPALSASKRRGGGEEEAAVSTQTATSSIRCPAVRQCQRSRVAVSGVLASGVRVECSDVSNDPFVGRLMKITAQTREGSQDAGCWWWVVSKKKKEAAIRSPQLMLSSPANAKRSRDSDGGGGRGTAASSLDTAAGGTRSLSTNESSCEDEEYLLSRTQGRTVTKKWVKARELIESGTAM